MNTITFHTFQSFHLIHVSEIAEKMVETTLEGVEGE